MLKPTAWIIALLSAAAGYGAMELCAAKPLRGFPDRMTPTNTVVRVYDVHRILARLARQLAEQRPNPASQNASQSPEQILQGTMQSSSTDPDDDDTNDADCLMDVIDRSVLPASWKDNGGDIGTMRYVGGMLIVEQSAEGQAKVEYFLSALEGVK